MTWEMAESSKEKEQNKTSKRHMVISLSLLEEDTEEGRGGSAMSGNTGAQGSANTG